MVRGRDGAGELLCAGNLIDAVARASVVVIHRLATGLVPGRLRSSGQGLRTPEVGGPLVPPDVSVILGQRPPTGAGYERTLFG